MLAYDFTTPGSTLCLVSDRTWHRIDAIADAVDAALQAGVNMLQFREKEGCGLSDRQRFELGRALRERARAHRVPFIVNDRLDLAMALDADGVHLGQGDLPLYCAQRLWEPNKIYGLSVSTEAEAQAGIQQGLTYLGMGAIFPTDTKADAVYGTLETLRTIVGLSNVPVIAIGGINASNAERVLQTGCAGIAVVSAVLGARDVAAATRELGAYFGLSHA